MENVMPQLNLTSAIILWSCALFIGGLMVGVYIWSAKHGTPMPFWTGSTLRTEELTDVSAYNRANLRMWLVYALCLAFTGVLALLNLWAGLIALGVMLVFGTVILIKVNKRIFYKYKSEKGTYRIEI